MSCHCSCHVANIYLQMKPGNSSRGSTKQSLSRCELFGVYALKPNTQVSSDAPVPTAGKKVRKNGWPLALLDHITLRRRGPEDSRKPGRAHPDEMDTEWTTRCITVLYPHHTGGANFRTALWPRLFPVPISHVLRVFNWQGEAVQLKSPAMSHTCAVSEWVGGCK